MTDQEILDLSRSQLDDNKLPYLWSSEEIIIYRNKAVDEVCRRLKHITDASTASDSNSLPVCKIPLLAGVPTYETSPKVIVVTNAILSQGSIPLVRTSAAWMNAYYSDWRNSTGTPSKYIPEYERNKIRIYPYYEDTYVVEGNANITFTAATKTISKASGLSIYEEGDSFTVEDTTSNDGTYTVVTVSDTAIVVSETLVNEADTSAVLRRVEETLNLEVIRLPLAWVTVADLTGEPPFDEDYHIDLMDGIKKHAYGKLDSETYDPKKVADYTESFARSIQRMIRERIDKTGFAQTAGPHSGAT